MIPYLLTNQKIPESKKNIDWHKGHINEFVTMMVKHTDDERKQKQLEVWKAYLCVTNKEGQLANAPVTKPYGLSLGMEWIDYPLIESALEQMAGEFITRGIKRKTYVINKKAQTAKLNELYDMISEEVLREANKELEPALGFVPETESPEKELPEDIEEFFETGYKTISEQVSDTILQQVLIAKKEIDKVYRLFLNFLLFDECIATVTEKNGHPCIDVDNIFETFIDFDPNKDVQDNAQYQIKNKWHSFNTIINSYELTKEEENILKGYLSNQDRRTDSDIDLSGMDTDGYDSPVNYGNWLKGEKDLLQIRCVEMRWISYVQLRVKVAVTKSGKELYKKLPENYKERKGDNIKSIWVQQKRKCFMVGPDLVLDWGVDEERFSRIDTPKEDSLPVVAIRRNNSLNSMQVRSAGSKLLQLQEFASECLFELRLCMRRNNGRVLVYDAAQVPKQFLKTGGYQNAINRVMHHAKKDQFLIINSQDKQSRYAFNQFTSLDMSSKGAMQDLFSTLALVEQLAAKFIGISPQQAGQVTQYETAVGTERAVTQTTVRQEVYVKPFESFLKYLFDKILIKGKYCYEEGEVAQYVFGDLKTKFFKVYPEYHQEDVGVYIADNFAEQKKKQTIDAAASQTMQSAQTPELILNLIETLNADTAGESEAIFKRGIKALNKLREEQSKAEQAAAQAQAEAEKAKTDLETELKREQFQNNIDVANIYNDGKTVTESMKNEAQKTMKLADIEKDLLLSDQKKGESSK